MYMINQDFPDIKYPINRETIGQIMGLSTDKVRDMLNEIGVPKGKALQPVHVKLFRRVYIEGE